MKTRSWLLFVFYLIVALYLLNLSLEVITLPELVSQYNGWVILVGAILILKGGIDHLRLRYKVFKDKLERIR